MPFTDISNDVLSNELELLDSMYSPTPASFDETSTSDAGRCFSISSNRPRFIFHIDFHEFGLDLDLLLENCAFPLILVICADSIPIFHANNEWIFMDLLDSAASSTGPATAGLAELLRTAAGICERRHHRKAHIVRACATKQWRPRRRALRHEEPG